MNSGILIALLFVSGIAVISAQDQLFRTMMLMNMLGGRRGQSRGSSRGSYQIGQAAASSSSTPQSSAYQTLSATRLGGKPTARRSYGGGLASSGLIRMMALSGQLGDSFRDMMMCTMMPMHMRRICILRGGGMM